MKPIRYISNDEIKIVGPKDNYNPDPYFCSIKWPDGNYSYCYVSINNIDLKKYLEKSIGGDFGPINVKCRYLEGYEVDPPNVWLVSFCANNIIANRDYLMDEHSFYLLVKDCGRFDHNNSYFERFEK